MERNILLTYTHTEGYLSYMWFENIEEMNSFINNNKDIIDEVNESYDCSNAEELIFDIDQNEFKSFIYNL